MLCVQQFQDQLAHLADVQHFSRPDGTVAGRIVEHAFPQVAGLDFLVFRQQLQDIFDEAFRLSVFHIRRQCRDPEGGFPGRFHIHSQFQEFLPVAFDQFHIGLGHIEEQRQEQLLGRDLLLLTDEFVIHDPFMGRMLVDQI